MDIENLKYIAYVAFYIALFSEDYGTIVRYESDFSKPITEEFIQEMVKSFIEYYDKRYGMKITNVQFVSKETYEAYCRAYHNSLDTKVSWKDDKIFINGKEA